MKRYLAFCITVFYVIQLNSSLAETSTLTARLAQTPPSLSACARYFLHKLGSLFDHRIMPRLKKEEDLIALLKRKQTRKPIRPLTDPAMVEWLREHPVYISLTTTPSRIQSLHHVLETLDLTNVAQVFISIPATFKRTGEPYIIPESLRRMHQVTILRPQQDEGPASKILTAADYLRTRAPHAMLISIDDDNAYPAGMVNELIYAAYQLPDAVIGSGGQTFNRFGINPPTTQQSHLQKMDINSVFYIPADLVEGYAGVLYPVDHIPIEDIRSYSHRCPQCFVSDDLVIGLALEKWQIPRYRIVSKYYGASSIRSFPYGDRSDALKNGAGVSTPSGSAHFRNYQTTFDALKSDVFGTP